MTHSINRALVATAFGAQIAAAQAPRVVPDEPACPRCTISVRTLATLGTDDGVGSLNGKPMSVNVDSRGRYWVFHELEPPTVFSASGAVERMLGRKGSGPGEFQSANNGVVVGDSMLVFDWLESRATMVGPDLKATRSIRIRSGMGDVIVLSWPTLLVTAGWFRESDPPNSTMHRLSLAGTDMQMLGSFGPRGVGGPMGNVDVGQIIGSGRDGIWSAYWNRPQFTRWDRNGIARASLVRRLDWYTGDAKGSIGTPTTPPTPRTGAIREDAEGLVWLFIHRPAPTWRDGWPTRGTRVGGGVEYSARAMVFDRMFRTYVEVIDPVQGRVVTSHTINGFVFEALADRRAALYTVDINGIPRVQIVSLSLDGR
jgi:hypothetical protein